MNVGTDGDTAAFAVESIRRWWQQWAGAVPARHPAYDHRRWRRVQRFAQPALENRARHARRRAGLAITVCHFPARHLQVEQNQHRMFCAISVNWRGRRSPSTESSSRPSSRPPPAPGSPFYPARPRLVPHRRQGHPPQIAALPVTLHGCHPDWNYTLHAAQGQARGPAEPGPQAPSGRGPRHPWPTPRADRVAP